MRHLIKPLTLAAGIVVLVAACAETSTAPNGADATRSSVANSAVKFWDVGASASETARLADVALDASLSRLYAGIHYRFDFEAGLALGRAVAAKAEAAKLDEVAVLP